MFYSFIREENINDILLISKYILDYQIGIYAILISIFIIFIKNLIPKFDKYYFLVFSIYAFGIYVSTFYTYDETFINLEHIYNLYHHQKLSISPVSMVNGTVDYFFCILLYPFAATKKLLIIGNYTLNFIFLFLHFLILFMYIKNKSRITFLILVLFASYLPFTWIFGKGFGNNIVSLFLMYSLILYFDGKINKSLLIASLMPILRPDAILYSVVIFFGHLLIKKRIEFKYLLLTFLSFLSLFIFTHVLYGHFIPLPMEFKSMSINELHLISAKPLFTNIFKVYNFCFLVIFIISYLFLKNNSNLSKTYYFFLPLFLIFVFYSLNFETQEFSRYHVGFLLFQSLFYVFLISDEKIYFNFTKNFNLKIKLNFLYKFQFYFASLIMFMTLVALIYIQNTRYTGSRVDNLSFGGQLVEKIIPKKWVVAVTELNTFGFSNDLVIYDMWGYSNNEIAKSKIRTIYKKKIVPGLFLKKSPKLFWFRTGNTNDKNRHITKLHPELILTLDNLAITHNYLGDMNKILKFYDFYSLIYKNYETLILVNKNYKNQFFNYLSENSFDLDYSKKLDMELFKLLYIVSD